MRSHNKILFFDWVTVFACSDSDEVIKHLVVRLIALRINLQVPVEELFVAGIWVLEECFVIENGLVFHFRNMRLVI